MTHPQTELADEFVDTASRPETRGIELVSDAERHGRARDLFFIWAAPNVSILNLTIGATLILLGLELWQAVAVIVAASLLWVFPGLIAGSGPASGTSGSVVTRAMYGILGNRLFVAFVGWFIGAVFLSLTWLASSFMGADLLRRMGLEDPVWVPIGVTVVVATITVLVAIFGHGLIVRAYSYMAAALFVIFLLVAGFILPTVDWQYAAPQPLEGVSLWSAMAIGFTILASTPLSFINSPDIARYRPRSTKHSHIALATGLGGGIPFIVFTIVGVLLATGLDAAAFAAGLDVALLDQPRLRVVAVADEDPKGRAAAAGGLLSSVHHPRLSPLAGISHRRIRLPAGLAPRRAGMLPVHRSAGRADGKRQRATLRRRDRPA